VRRACEFRNVCQRTTGKASAATAVGFSAGSANGNYAVAVSLNGHEVAHRVLHSTFNFTPSQRVWQGTDAFINYCINQSKQTYSLNLRLYCVRPSSSFGDVTLSEH
jgi:hypothetical protein